MMNNYIYLDMWKYETGEITITVEHQDNEDMYLVEWAPPHLVKITPRFLDDAVRIGFARATLPLNRGDVFHIGQLHLKHFGYDIPSDTMYAVVVNDTIGAHKYLGLVSANELSKLYLQFLRFCARRGWMDIHPGEYLSYDKLKVVKWLHYLIPIRLRNPLASFMRKSGRK